jgi:hypothetical protein
MKRLRWSHLAILGLFGVCLGCGRGEKAVVPSGPVAVPKEPPKTVPMIGPKIPHNQGK